MEEDEKEDPIVCPNRELEKVIVSEIHSAGLDEDEDVLLVDVRPHREFLKEHFKNSVNFCISNFLLRRFSRGSTCKVDINRIIHDKKSCTRVKSFASGSFRKTIIAYDEDSRFLGMISGIKIQVALDLIQKNLIRGVEFSSQNIVARHLEGGYNALKKFYVSQSRNSSLQLPSKIVYHSSETQDIPNNISGLSMELSLIAPSPGPLKVSTSLTTQKHHHKKNSPNLTSLVLVDKFFPRQTSDSLLKTRFVDEHTSDQSRSLSPSSSISEDTLSASLVLPHLIIGSNEIFQSTDAISLLKSFNISHILNMTFEKEDEKIINSGLFVIKSFAVEDHVDSEVDNLLYDVVSYIHSVHLQSDKNVVFVHCRAGRSRSATVAIAYLIKYANMSLTRAYELVKAVRPGISPNLGFFVSLQEFERKVFKSRHTKS